MAKTAEMSAAHKTGDGLRIAFGVGGLIAFVLGLIVLIAPAPSAKVAAGVTAALLAVYVIVTGVVYLGGAIFSRSAGGWSRVGHILLGLLYVVGGVIMMSNLLATGAIVFLFITITIGVLWLFEGVTALTVVGKGANAGASKTWTIIYAIVSIIAGIALLFTPLMSAAVLWILLGASMVVLGAAQAVRAFMMKAGD